MTICFMMSFFATESMSLCASEALSLWYSDTASVPETLASVAEDLCHIGVVSVPQRDIVVYAAIEVPVRTDRVGGQVRWVDRTAQGL